MAIWFYLKSWSFSAVYHVLFFLNMMLSKRKDEETLCAAYNTDGALIYHFHQSDILPAKKKTLHNQLLRLCSCTHACLINFKPSLDIFAKSKIMNLSQVAYIVNCPRINSLHNKR